MQRHPRSDNGFELILMELDLWAWTYGVTIDFAWPGKSSDNAFAESPNGTVLAERLKASWLLRLADVRSSELAIQ